MPLINGRYHMNRTMGDALEAAREAEAAMLALQQRAADNSQGDDSDPQSQDGDHAPIHHIEIDAAEVVPNATGRATRGFVARVHRACAPPTAPSLGSSSTSSENISSAPAPESHVFTDHRDLLNFLQSALARQ